MKIDLHSHSAASDGTYSPSALLNLACEHHIEMFALTDHDTMAGYLALQTEAKDLPVRLIAGVEISTIHKVSEGYGKNTLLDKSIHVVALDVQDCQKMQSALQVIQDSRAGRGRAMVEKLAVIFSDVEGVTFERLWQAVLDKVGGEIQAIGRPHIAQVLQAFGLVRTVTDAFDKYLGEGKPAYVPLQTLSMEEAIVLIHECGGLAVLAHPTRYRLSATRIRRLIADFACFGGDGCELPSPQEPLSTRQMVDRAILANELLVSVGSDFHGAITPWRKLGQVASLKEGQVGVWTKFVRA